MQLQNLLWPLHRGDKFFVGIHGHVIVNHVRRTLKLDQVRFLALDEADEMLRMGFAEDVEQIVSHAPQERQVALFSATMPPDIVRVAKRHPKNPGQIAAAPQTATATSLNPTHT